MPLITLLRLIALIKNLIWSLSTSLTFIILSDFFKPNISLSIQLSCIFSILMSRICKYYFIYTLKGSFLFIFFIDQPISVHCLPMLKGILMSFIILKLVKTKYNNWLKIFKQLLYYILTMIFVYLFSTGNRNSWLLGSKFRPSNLAFNTNWSSAGFSIAVIIDWIY